MNDFIKEMNERDMLAYADELIEKVKETETDKAKLEQVAKDRIDLINSQLEEKSAKLDGWIEQYKFSLLQIANLTTTKETKTQRKLELLAGDVIIKKATKKFKNDNKAILEAVKDERKDLVKEKVTTSLDWAKFEKELEIIGDGADAEIINTTTGEVVNIAGLEVEEVPERLEVK